MTASGASPAPSAAAAPHLEALTGIRGLAAWAVVLFHLRVSLVTVLPGWGMAIAAKGYLAVDLFFMLSGFVLWYNYADRLRSGGWAATSQFWWRRVARIWPLHAAILTLFVAYALLAVWRGLAAGKPAGNNPWGEGANTLEWTLSSPPPFHQFETLPVIEDNDHH